MPSPTRTWPIRRSRTGSRASRRSWRPPRACGASAGAARRAGSRRPPRSSCTRATPPSAWTRSRASATCAWRRDGDAARRVAPPDGAVRDLAADALVPPGGGRPPRRASTESGTVTRCPYKGQARFWALPGGRDLAWSYPEPIPECPRIAGLVAFFNEHVDLTVDGEPQPRPFTPWSLDSRGERFASLPPAHDAHRGRIHRLRRRRDPVGQPRPAARRLGRALRLASSQFAETRSSGRSATTSARASTRSSTTAGVNTDDIEHVARRQDLLLGRPLPPRHQPARHAADRPERLPGLRAQALARPRAPPTCCSWPTSSPTSSARCASSARSARFVAMDSMNLWIDIARDALAARRSRSSTASCSTTASSSSSPTSRT